MKKLDLKELKGLKKRVDAESADVINEFIDACNEVSDLEELDEYVDLLLGVAEELSEEDQQVIYNLIDAIQQ